MGIRRLFFKHLATPGTHQNPAGTAEFHAWRSI